jgi:undecaprenyl-diphosphatase
MTILQALILGIIEGITEFLPVSSTAHLIVAQKLFGLESVNEFFTVVVQLGAIAGLIVAERKKLAQIVREFASSLGTRRQSLASTQAAQLAIATIPILIVGFLIKDQVDMLQNNLSLIAFMSISVAMVFVLAEWFSKRQNASYQSPATSRQLFIMGLFQIISLIPGTSRSGITAAGGAFQQMTLSQALEYSFLLSIPALLAAGGYEILKTIQTPMDSAIILPTLIATIVAFISSIIAIEWLRRIVRTVGFTPFVIYRFLFAAVILFIK